MRRLSPRLPAEQICWCRRLVARLESPGPQVKYQQTPTGRPAFDPNQEER